MIGTIADSLEKGDHVSNTSCGMGKAATCQAFGAGVNHHDIMMGVGPINSSVPPVGLLSGRANGFAGAVVSLYRRSQRSLLWPIGPGNGCREACLPQTVALYG